MSLFYINMEKTFDNLFLYYIIVLFTVIIYYISNYSFEDNNPTCNNFVINIYLYLAISICIVGLFAYLINYILFKKSSSYYKPLDSDFVIFNFLSVPFYYLSLLFSLIFVILISISPNFESDNVLYNHILWLLFLFTISFNLYPVFKDIDTYKFIDQALIITSFIFVIMTGFYYLFSDFFDNNSNIIGMGLIISLVSIIIIELFNLLFGFLSLGSMRFISYFVIILFCIFISYDTSEMIRKEKLCTSLPNYPKFSIDFFLDILNIFKNALFLRSK